MSLIVESLADAFEHVYVQVREIPAGKIPAFKPGKALKEGIK